MGHLPSAATQSGRDEETTHRSNVGYTGSSVGHFVCGPILGAVLSAVEAAVGCASGGLRATSPLALDAAGDLGQACSEH